MRKTLSIIIALALLVTACASTRDADGETFTEETTTAEETFEETTAEETTEETATAEQTAAEIETSVSTVDSYGNIVNGGYAAYDGEWIYYNGFDNKCFYKMREDGSEITLLADHRASDINVVGDWIYYKYYEYGNEHISLDDEGYPHAENSGIFKMRTDGSEETLLTDDFAPDCVTYSDGWIYYSLYIERFEWKDKDDYVFIPSSIPSNEEKSGIFKIRPDGSERTRVTDAPDGDIYYMNVVGDWIYYVTNDWSYLYKVRTDGAEKTLILSEVHIQKIDVVGDWIYYATGPGYGMCIYKIRTDGSENTLVTDNEAFNELNVAGDWIYYSGRYEEGHTSALYKMRLDGSETTLLFDKFVDGVNIVGDWVIYSSFGTDYGESTFYCIMRPDGSEHRLLD